MEVINNIDVAVADIEIICEEYRTAIYLIHDNGKPGNYPLKRKIIKLANFSITEPRKRCIYLGGVLIIPRGDQSLVGKYGNSLMLLDTIQ